MKMKSLAKALTMYEQTSFDKQIDKEIQNLLQLRAVSKIISLVKSLSWDVVPKHLNETFKCTIEKLHTLPETWGIVYSVGNERGKLQFNDYNLEFLSRGMESIQDNKLVELASLGFKVEYNFEKKLIYMLIGKTLFEEYYENSLELEMNMEKEGKFL